MFSLFNLNEGASNSSNTEKYKNMQQIARS